MIGYIVEGKTLEIEKLVNFTQYSLPIDGLPSSTGTITLSEKLLTDYSGYALIIDGIEDIFVINEYSISNDNTTSLSISPYIKVLLEKSPDYVVYDTYTSDNDIIKNVLDLALCYMKYSSDYKERYTESDSNFLPTGRTLTTIEDRQIIDAYGTSQSTVVDNALNRINTDIMSNIENLTLESRTESSTSTRYVFDTVKFVEYLINSGVKFKIKLQNHSFFTRRIKTAQVGYGIEYGNKKYRITQLYTTYMRATEDSTLQDVQLIAYKSPSDSTPTTVIFRNEDLNWKIPVTIRPGTTATVCSAALFDMSVIEDSIKTIYFNDGNSQIKTASFDNDVVSCIVITIFSTTANELSAIFGYYLKSDLTIGDYHDKDEQIKGKTVSKVLKLAKTYSNMSWLDGVSTAVTEFANNTYKHKVEFYSNERMYCGQRVRLIFDEKILDTTINGVTLSSDDNRYLYTCGEGANTASEKIKSNSWKYGRRLPLAPYKGQLVFM